MDKGTIIPIFGEEIQVLVSSAESNNTLVVAVQTSPPGGGPQCTVTCKKKSSLFWKANTRSSTTGIGFP